MMELGWGLRETQVLLQMALTQPPLEVDPHTTPRLRGKDFLLTAGFFASLPSACPNSRELLWAGEIMYGTIPTRVECARNIPGLSWVVTIDNPNGQKTIMMSEGQRGIVYGFEEFPRGWQSNYRSCSQPIEFKLEVPFQVPRGRDYLDPTELPLIRVENIRRRAMECTAVGYKPRAALKIVRDLALAIRSSDRDPSQLGA